MSQQLTHYGKHILFIVKCIFIFDLHILRSPKKFLIHQPKRQHTAREQIILFHGTFQLRTFRRRRLFCSHLFNPTNK